MHLKYLFIVLTGLLVALASCQSDQNQRTAISSLDNDTAGLNLQAQKLDTATFAGGCFWCTEAYFERVKGVKLVVSGYSGGTSPNPTYKQVSAGKTDHAESIQLYYDSTEVGYGELLKVFFATMDPTQLNRQGPDVGAQYRSIVFYHNQRQQQQAQDYIEHLEASGQYSSPVVTTVEPYRRFYLAEDYHQDYYRLNPNDPYVRSVTRPKVKKFEKEFQAMLKQEYNQ